MNKPRYTHEEIREHKREYHRRYIENRKKQNNPVDFKKYKRTKKKPVEIVQDSSESDKLEAELELIETEILKQKPLSKEFDQLTEKRKIILIKLSKYESKSDRYC